MKNLKTQFAVLVLSTVSLLTGAFGQLTPIGDSYTNTAAATTNYGAKTLLDVESTQTTFIQVYPSALVMDAAGNLYGTTEFSGTFHFGSVFEVTVFGIPQRF